jgi:hypothetical protein
MSTRPKRHAGNKQRGWEELNVSHGQTGLMESEVWYMALRALKDENTDAAEAALIDHFGTLQEARFAYKSLAPQVAERFEEVADACLEEDAA